MEPDAQNARLEMPVSGADPEPGTQPGEVSAALRVQILSTEHWSLLATRSQTWSESFARAQMFLSVLSASVIALALVAQTSLFGAGFTAFALVLLPVVLFLGLATYVRLVSINHDEHRWVRGMNRIRAGYLELAPELERYFVTSHHDDERGILATAGWKSGPTLFGYVTTPAVVGVIDAVLAGVITLSRDSCARARESLGRGARRCGGGRVEPWSQPLRRARVPSGIREPSGHQSKPRGSLTLPGLLAARGLLQLWLYDKPAL
jgi:hypothetical protein